MQKLIFLKSPRIFNITIRTLKFCTLLHLSRLNPLSIGDRVRIKDNHYFGGLEGVITQIPSPHSLVVAFDNDQRELIRLQDLDLPLIESLISTFVVKYYLIFGFQ